MTRVIECGAERSGRGLGVGLVLLAAVLTPGCYNSLLITPVHVDGGVSETTVREADGWLCRDKIALIDVEGMILNAKSTSLFGGSGQLFWNCFTGPGRVGLQSMYVHLGASE